MILWRSAGIALKVGIDIIDWDFLRRAHHLSVKAALITYGVIALTVLVDLIAAVGIGVFVANVLTIDRMSALQSKRVKTISTTDDDVELSVDEQQLVDQASGRVLLFQLAGPMIFGVAKAISREHNAIGECEAVIFDLHEVSHLGVRPPWPLKMPSRKPWKWVARCIWCFCLVSPVVASRS